MNEQNSTDHQSNNTPLQDKGRSLDQLFAQTQSDAAYLESESTKRTLLNAVMDINESSARREIIPLWSRLSFKIGATIMTLLTTGAAVILAVGLFNGPSTSTSTSPRNFASPVQIQYPITTTATARPVQTAAIAN